MRSASAHRRGRSSFVCSFAFFLAVVLHQPVQAVFRISRTRFHHHGQIPLRFPCRILRLQRLQQRFVLPLLPTQPDKRCPNRFLLHFDPQALTSFSFGLSIFRKNSLLRFLLIFLEDKRSLTFAETYFKKRGDF